MQVIAGSRYECAKSFILSIIQESAQTEPTLLLGRFERGYKADKMHIQAAYPAKAAPSFRSRAACSRSGERG